MQDEISNEQWMNFLKKLLYLPTKLWHVPLWKVNAALHEHVLFMHSANVVCLEHWLLYSHELPIATSSISDN